MLADFSGGMNSLAAVDKLAPNECLLAENVRLDETGNVAIAGAYTRQNTAAYVDTASNSNVHSVYWNPAIGGVAGVGQDVFIGPSLGTLTDALQGQNANFQKMSFASAPNRIYFDVGSVGYWTDMTNVLLVDWVPASAGSAVVTGPNTGTLSGGTSGTSTNYGFGLSGQPVQGIRATIVATTTFLCPANHTQTTARSAAMLVGGVPVGTSTAALFSFTNVNPFVGITYTRTHTITYGNQSTTWGYPGVTLAQVNASNFGILYSASVVAGGGSLIHASFSAPTITTYQSAVGFSAGAGTTGTLTGTYTWKVTFVAANGEESDASSPSVSVVLSTQQGTLTAVPTSDARTTSRNVYRKGGGLTSYYLVGSIPDNVSTTYSDNQSDLAALAQGSILSGDVPGDFPNSRLGAVHVKFPVYHYDRVFWVNQDKPNQIIWSKPLNGFAYPAVNFANVGDSASISRIISIFGELIIIKSDSSIWVLTGSDESSFALSRTPSNQGTDMPYSVTALPDKIIFANRWGLWMFNGYTSVPVTTKLDLWFKQQDRTGNSLFGVNGFHPPEIANGMVYPLFSSIGNAEKYILAYAEAGQAANNVSLFLDVKRGNITKRTWPALSFAIDPQNGFAYMGDALGFISYIEDWTAPGSGGSALNMDFQTGYYNFARGSNQSFWALEFYINTNGQSVTPYAYYDNGEASEALPVIVTTQMMRVVRPLQNSVSRKAQSISVRINASSVLANVSGTPQIVMNSVKPLFDVRTGRARTGQ